MATENKVFSIVVNIYNTFVKQLEGTEIPFKSFVLSLLIFGLQQFFSNIVFSCPEKNYVAYGVLFIVGPFVILFCISMQVSESFWALTTGCCRVPLDRQTVIWVRASGSLFLATLPPLLWLVFAFASKDFYVCAKLGSKEIALENKTKTEQAEITKQFNQAKSDSQVIAWALFISFTVFSTAVVSARRFYKINRKLQGQEDFDKYEADETITYFNSKLKPMAQEKAKELVDSLMEKFKDQNRESLVRMCEVELEERYPNHSGVVAGKYRKGGTSSRPKPLISTMPDDGGEAVPLQPTHA